MADCYHCDERVHFLRNNGVWSAPLEIESATQTGDNSKGYTVTTVYRIHECEQMRKARAQRKDRRAREQQINAIQRGQDWKLALTIPCRKCGVKAGERCLNLVSRSKSVVQETKWPHPDRVDAALVALNKRREASR